MTRVVIIGPESTGKTLLSKQLSAHFKVPCVEEYARIYLEQHGLAYDYETLLKIANGQIQLEDSCMQKSQHDFIILDTNLYVLKVWSEFVFGRCHYWILDQLAVRNYDIYLLMNIDFPWQYDPMREHPDDETRQYLFAMYKSIMITENKKWITISGNINERLLQSIDYIKHCNRKK